MGKGQFGHDFTCEACRFYDGKRCRRHAPVIVPEDENNCRGSFWPTVDGDDWCGEFLPYVGSGYEMQGWDEEA